MALPDPHFSSNAMPDFFKLYFEVQKLIFRLYLNIQHQIAKFAFQVWYNAHLYKKKKIFEAYFVFDINLFFTFYLNFQNNFKFSQKNLKRL